MSETTKLGTQPGPEARRDAVHVAIVPMVAGRTMEAGAPVHVFDGKAWPTLDSNKDTAIGVVDPFCGGVSNGARFWLCLKPGTITGMRHHWEHPAFPNALEQPAIDAGVIAKARLICDECGQEVAAAQDHEAQQANLARQMQEGEAWLEAKRVVAAQTEVVRDSFATWGSDDPAEVHKLLAALDRLAKVEKLEGGL